MFKQFENASKKTILVISVVFAALIAILDYYSGSAFPLVILYFLPLTIVVWYINLRVGILFSFLCIALSVLAELFYGKIFFTDHIFFINMIKRFVVFLFFSLIIYILKRNLETSAKNKLIIQRNQAIIHTSQRATGVIVESIAKHNSELLRWINKQKENGQHVPEVIETVHRNIGVSLRALSEASFCETVDSDDLDVDDFISLLQKKLKYSGDKIFNKLRK